MLYLLRQNRRRSKKVTDQIYASDPAVPSLILVYLPSSPARAPSRMGKPCPQPRSFTTSVASASSPQTFGLHDGTRLFPSPQPEFPGTERENSFSFQTPLPPWRSLRETWLKIDIASPSPGLRFSATRVVPACRVRLLYSRLLEEATHS